MKALKEITKWDCEGTIPNHTYLINDAGKMVAYRNTNTKEVKFFNKPLTFDQRYRKFTKVSLELFGVE